MPCLRRLCVIVAVLSIALHVAPARADDCPSCPKVTVTDLLGQFQLDEETVRGTMQLPGATAPLDREDRQADEWNKKIEKIDYEGLD